LSDIAVDGEQEFISAASRDSTGIFCTFLHLKAGGALLIQKTLLDEKAFSIEQLAQDTEEGIEGHLKDYTYFFITKDLLILKSTKGISPGDIEIYLNWLLKKDIAKYADKNAVLNLRPHLKKEFDLSIVKSIQIGNCVKIVENRPIETMIQPLFKGLEKLLDSEGLDGVNIHDIVDAKLILTIQRPAAKDETKNKKALQAILNAVNSDETVIKDKQGRQIHANSIKETKELRVPYLNSGFPDVAILEQEMRSYYGEVLKP
jgi:hypothetical protein